MKYKLLLGTLIIGLTATAAGCKSKKDVVTCYDISVSPDPEPQIMCYYPAFPEPDIPPIDSIKVKENEKPQEEPTHNL